MIYDPSHNIHIFLFICNEHSCQNPLFSIQPQIRPHIYTDHSWVACCVHLLTLLHSVSFVFSCARIWKRNTKLHPILSIHSHSLCNGQHFYDNPAALPCLSISRDKWMSGGMRLYGMYGIGGNRRLCKLKHRAVSYKHDRWPFHESTRNKHCLTLTETVSEMAHRQKSRQTAYAQQNLCGGYLCINAKSIAHIWFCLLVSTWIREIWNFVFFSRVDVSCSPSRTDAATTEPMHAVSIYI